MIRVATDNNIANHSGIAANKSKKSRPHHPPQRALANSVDSSAASAEWALHPYLVTTRDSSALDIIDRIAAEAPDTVAAWVVDTTNLARSYDMEVRAVRACG